MKLSTLKKQAQRNTKALGHRMAWDKPESFTHDQSEQWGECKDCCKQVTLGEGQQWTIDGAALRVKCIKQEATI